MGTYTVRLRDRQQELDPDADDFQESLLAVAEEFRSFGEGLDGILRLHGFDGDLSDEKEKLAFLRQAFEREGIPVPRGMPEWFSNEKRIRRKTAFRLCFALGMNADEVRDFFCRILMQRSFDCRNIPELVFYFCFRNGYSWRKAQEILQKAASLQKKDSFREADAASGPYYTDAIRQDADEMKTADELIAYIADHARQMSGKNRSGRAVVTGLWNEIAGRGKEQNGLALQEAGRMALEHADGGVQLLEQQKSGKKISDFDIYLAIMDLDPVEVAGLSRDHRTITSILTRLHPLAQDCFPDRDGLSKILHGERVSYERIRKMIILLAFYRYWATWRIRYGYGIATDRDRKRGAAIIDSYLLEGGYDSLYPGNPYDFIFIYCGSQDDPLGVFRQIMGELLADRVDEISKGK